MSLSSKVNYAFEALSGITVGNINITGNIFQNNNPYIASQWTSTSGNALTYTSGNVIISNGSLVTSNLTTGNINFTGTLSQNGSPYIGSQWTGTSGTLYYGTSGSSVVGINTTTPIYTLDINGTLEASNANGLMLFASTGNLGIGTTAPSTKLDVVGTGRITTSLTTGALYSTNQTTTNIVATTATITNLNIPGTLTVVNITSTNLVDTNITATNLRVTGTTSVANIYSSLGTISSLVSTNLSTSTLAVSSNMVTPRIDIGGTQSTYNNNTLGKLFITGGQNSITGGPNILITTTQDAFPTYHFLTYGHDSSWTCYDMYYDGSFRNSGTSTAFMMVKQSSSLRWNYNISGFSAGAVAPFSTSICIGSNGNVGLGGQVAPEYILDVTGNARISSGLTAGASTFTSVSSGDSQFSNLSTGNINFTGNLFQNGSAYIGSQWIGTSGNIYFGTTGSSVVGINTTSPSTTLDVTGTARITTSLTTGALFSTNQTTTNIVNTNQTTTNIVNTNQTTTNIVNTNQTTTNLINTNISTGTVNLSTGATAAAIRVTGLSTLATATATNVSVTTLNASTGATTAALRVTGLSTLATVTATNVSSTTLNASTGITTGTITATGVSSLQNVTATNITASNITVIGTSTSTNSSSGSVVLLGGLSIDEPTNATSVSNGGALTISGGAAIAGDLIVGGSILYSNAAAASSTFAYLTLTATDWSTDVANGGLVVYGGISIQNTANATSASSGNGLTIAGGAGIGADLYVGGVGYLPNVVSTNQTTTNIVATGISAANINVSGTLTVVNITSTNLLETNITASNLRVTSTTSTANIYTSLGTISNLVGTNLSSSNLIATVGTIPNIVHTNVSSGTYSGTTVSSANIYASLGTVSNLVGTNLSSSNLIATVATIPNIVHTNVSSGTYSGTTVSSANIYASLGTVSNLVGTNLSSSNLTSTTSTLQNMVSTNITTATLQATTGITSSSLLVTSLISAANIFSPNISANNLTSNLANVSELSPKTAITNSASNVILLRSNTNIDNFINFRNSGAAPRGFSGVMFSSLEGSHFINYNTGTVQTTGGNYIIAFSNEISDTPSISSSTTLLTLTSSGNLSITGALSSINQTTTNIVGTNITTATLNTTTGITSAALLVTGLVSSANLFATTSTIPNIVHTNVTATNYVGTTLSTSNIYASLGTVSNFVGTSLSSSNLTATAATITNLNVPGTLTVVNITSTNLAETNITTATIQATTGITSAALLVTGLVSSANLFATTSTIPNIVHTNISSATLQTTTGITSAALLVTGLVSSANLFATTATIPNIVHTNITASNYVGTTISTANIYAFLGTVSNLVGTNLSSSNLISTTATIPNIIHTNITTTSVFVTGGGVMATFNSNTIGNIFTTGGNVGIATTTPAYTVDINGTFEAANSNGLILFASSGNVGIGTTNPLYLLDVNGTIDALTVTTGNLNSGIATIGTLLNTNMVSTNISSGTLNLSTGLTSASVQATNIIATAISASNINVSGTLTVVNITSTNLMDTNITTTSIIVTGGSLNATFNSNTIGNLFTTGGNVGINTVTPNGYLHVSGGTSGNIIIDTLIGGNAGYQYIGFNGFTNRQTSIETRINTNKLRWRQIVDQRGGNDYMSIEAFNGSYTPFSFVLLVGTQGNVKLSTVGEARYHLYNGAGTAEWLYGQKSSTRSDFTFTKLVAGGESDYMTITTGGNVGIGTSAPPYKLDINGSTRITNTSATSMGTLIVSGPNSSSPATATSGQLASFYGVGGANSISNIDLSSFQTTSAAMSLPSARFSMQDLGSNNSSFNILTKNAGVTGTMASRIFIDGSGSVGINTTNPANTIDVLGTGRITTSLTTGALYSTNQTTTNIVSTAISSANVIVNDNLNISGISSFFGGSFSANNNVVSVANVTGLLFPSATVRSFIATLNINISKPSGNLNSTVTLEGTQLDSGWILYDSALGDSTGLVFTINSSGQVLYTSPNYVGWVSTTIRFEAHYYTLAGTYTPVILPTSGNVSVTGVLSVNSTSNATSTSSGALTVSGGAGIAKSLLVGENLNVGGLSNTFTGSFAAANNVAAATNVSGLLVPTATFSSFTANVNVRILTTLTTLNAQYIFEATQSTGGWLLNDSLFGDSVGITFTITPAGQIQYTSTNVANWQSTTINFAVNAISISSGFTAVLPTSGNVAISGNLTIDDTTDSSSTSAASLVLAGGMGINKSLLVGGNFNIGGVTTQFAGTFSAANSASGSNITGLLFPNANIRSFSCTISLRVISSVNYNTQHTIDGIQRATGGWQISDSQIGDVSGITFAINSSGQITYTSPTFTSWTSTTMHYNAVAYNISSSYTPMPMPTGGSSSVAGSLVIQSTDIASSTSSGALSVSGGVGIQNNLIVNDETLASGGILIPSTTTLEFGYGVAGKDPAAGKIGYNSFTSGLNIMGSGTTNNNRLVFIYDKVAMPNVISNNRLSLWNGGTAEHDFYGLGINSFTLRYQTAINGAHRFYAATSATSSNELMSILGTGNVGIGTTAPSTLLEINGVASNISSGSFRITSVGSTTASGLQATGNIHITSPLSTSHLYYGITGSGVDSVSGAGTNNPQVGMLFSGNVSQGTYIHLLTSNAYVSGAQQRLTIKPDGNVGIGTTNPTFTLDVNGSIRATGPGGVGTNGAMLITGTDVYGHTLYIATNASNKRIGFNHNGTVGNIFAYDYGGLVSQNLILQLPGGNVGIGTTSPIASLDFGSGSTSKRIGLAVQSTNFWGFGAANSSIEYQVPSGSEHRFYTGSTTTALGTERMRIATAGNVGIGTTSPIYRLDVEGNMRTITGTSSSILVNTDGAAGWGNFEMFGTNGAYIDFKNASGDDYDARIKNVGSNNSLGFYMNAAETTGMSLTSAGTLLISGDIGAFATISDRTLKTNITDISPDTALETVKTLRPVTFNWKDDIFNAARRGEFDSGFIAQEVEEVIPHAVGTYNTIDHQNTYKNMRHERIIPYLVGSIQQLEETINKLQQRITILESR